jgi:hypothetical protein
MSWESNRTGLEAEVIVNEMQGVDSMPRNKGKQALEAFIQIRHVS